MGDRGVTTAEREQYAPVGSRQSVRAGQFARERDMDHKTVVAWDGSAAADAALDWAIEREHARGGTIALVRVIDDVAPAIEYQEAQREVTAERDELDAAAARATEAAPGCLVTSTTIRGLPYDELIRFVGPECLLAVGTQRRTAARFHYGWSMGARLAAAARGAVAIIPAVSTGLRRGIVVGYDGSPESRTAVSLAAADAAGQSEPLVIVHAWGEPTLMAGQPILDPMMMNALREESDHLLAEAAAQVAHEFPLVVVERQSLNLTPHEALLRSARGAVELVLGTRGLRGIRRVLLGSVTHRVVLDLACPVIIVGAAGPAGPGGAEATVR